MNTKGPYTYDVTFSEGGGVLRKVTSPKNKYRDSPFNVDFLGKEKSYKEKGVTNPDANSLLNKILKQNEPFISRAVVIL